MSKHYTLADLHDVRVGDELWFGCCQTSRGAVIGVEDDHFVVAMDNGTWRTVGDLTTPHEIYRKEESS